MTTSINILSLPADGGSPITDIEYRVNEGTAIGLGETTTGSYEITADLNDDVQIRAVNAVGPGPWSDTKVVAEPVPTQMSAPVVTATSETSISADLDTENGTGDIIRTDIRYSTDEADWTEVLDVVNPVSITGLDPNTEYFVQSREVNAAGEGPWSDSGSATTLSEDTTPPTVTIDDFEDDTATVTASDDQSATIDLFWTIDDEETAPSNTQVVAGQDHTGAAALLDGSELGIVEGSQDIPIDTSSLEDGDYNLRVVARDESGNLSTVVSQSFSIAAGTVDILAGDRGSFTDPDLWTTDAGVTVTGGEVVFDTGSNFDRIDSAAAHRPPCPENVTLSMSIDCTEAAGSSRFRMRLLSYDASNTFIAGSSVEFWDTNSAEDPAFSSVGTYTKSDVYTTPAGTAFVAFRMEAVLSGTTGKFTNLKLEY